MSKLLNIFMLSGAVLGLFLNFTPEYFSRVAVPAKPAPVSNNVSNDIEKVSKVIQVVTVVINERSFAVSLESLDKKYILDVARNFCMEKAEILNVGIDELENGCVRPVSAFLFKEVYGAEKIKEFPVLVVLPVNGQGSFNIKFDLIKVTPNQAARSFCLEKQAQFQVRDEDLESSCVVGVDAFIVRDLQRQEILKKEDEEPAVEEVAQQQQEQQQQVETQHEQNQVQQEEQQQQQHHATEPPSQVEEETARKVVDRSPPAVPRDIHELAIPPHEEHPEVRVETAVEPDSRPTEAAVAVEESVEEPHAKEFI